MRVADLGEDRRCDCDAGGRGDGEEELAAERRGRAAPQVVGAVALRHRHGRNLERFSSEEAGLAAIGLSETRAPHPFKPTQSFGVVVPSGGFFNNDIEGVLRRTRITMSALLELVQVKNARRGWSAAVRGGRHPGAVGDKGALPFETN